MGDLQTICLTLRIFVARRIKPRLSTESMLKCCTIYGLLEIEHTWAQLDTPGILRKVGLLPSSQPIVQVDEAPADLGKYHIA